MAKRRYTKEFREFAVERLRGCENIKALARELHVSRRQLYRWRDELDPEIPGMEALGQKRTSTLRNIMGEILYNVPRLRKSHASLDVWANDSTVLLAAAAEAYFRREVTVSALKAVLKLHYSKFEDFIRLSRQERSVVKRLMDVDQFAKPIYSWRGETAILGEEWAGCLGVADTRSLFALIDRLWKQNSEVRRILDAEDIELLKPEHKTPCFRDFGISRYLMHLWNSKIQFFHQPCVFRRWE